ncbi:Translin [Ceratobasidium theobromae]|uniref:Translin n=1 Tax=Ceratobasidium theobromae TaxID=1582974 RepID=A0A5N5QMW9_9AGAM|nr:Translin [Ceratobasidium theobromae]
MASSANPFAPRSGCPMCSIVTATPNPTPLSSPRVPTFPGPSGTPTAAQTPIIWKDENVTAYVEKNNPVSSKGHIIILLNLHVPSIYSLSSTDLPLLVHIQRLAHRLLSQLHPSSMASSFAPSSNLNPPPSPGPNSSPNVPLTSSSPFHVGFITPPFRDSKIPVTDHLHAHAYIGALDRAGWWRAVAYSSVGWYSIEDLIAEIREQTSNNRVRSNDPERKNSRPIDRVPNAGARAGLPDGRELNDRGLALDSLDAAEEGATQSQRGSMENQPGSSKRDSHIPLMRVHTPDIVIENADESHNRWRGGSRPGNSSTPDIPLAQSSNPSSSPSPPAIAA